MKRLVMVFLVVGLLLGGATFAMAKGTANEAQANVDKAIAYFQANLCKTSVRDSGI